jgi:hypothetical protein
VLDADANRTIAEPVQQVFAGRAYEGAANMVKGVANVWVPVEDVERALDFY